MLDRGVPVRLEAPPGIWAVDGTEFLDDVIFFAAVTGAVLVPVIAIAGTAGFRGDGSTPAIRAPARPTGWKGVRWGLLRRLMTITGASAVRINCHLPLPSPRAPSISAPGGHPAELPDSRFCAVGVNAVPGGNEIETSEATPSSSMPSTRIVTDWSLGLTRRRWLTCSWLLPGLTRGLGTGCRFRARTRTSTSGTRPPCAYKRSPQYSTHWKPPATSCPDRGTVRENWLEPECELS